MNRDQFRQRAASAGIRPGAYSLEGGLPPETYVLTIEGGGWSVYYSERGDRVDERRYDTEDEACSDLLLRLVADPTTREGRCVLEPGDSRNDHQDSDYRCWPLGDHLFPTRWSHGHRSEPVGAVFDADTTGSRSTLALPPTNTTSRIAQFQIRPGAIYFTRAW